MDLKSKEIDCSLDSIAVLDEYVTKDMSPLCFNAQFPIHETITLHI